MLSLSNIFGWEKPEDQKKSSSTSLDVAQEATPASSRNFICVNENEEEDDLLTRIQKFFSKSEPDDNNKPNQSLDMNARSVRYNSIYSGGSLSLLSKKSKYPILRTEMAPSHEKRNSISTATNGGHFEKFANACIPDAFKQSFDLSCDVDEEAPNNGLGVLEFSLLYLFDKNILFVKILKATDLPAMDLCGTSDPFVKCCLLPDRKRKLETKTKRKTLNPVWNEVLSFEGLTFEKIQQRVLYMQVFDYDRFSRNDPIGEVCIPLHTVDLTKDTFRKIMLEPCQKSNKRGELLLSLCYQPIEGKLEIFIKHGRNLKPMDLNGTSDPYVKIWFMIKNKRIEKQKTKVIKNTLNPNFQQIFTFHVPMAKLRDVQFEITVMDKDVIKKNDTIGKIYLGHKSTGLEKQHWKDMLANTRKAVSQWHVLKI